MLEIHPRNEQAGAAGSQRDHRVAIFSSGHDLDRTAEAIGNALGLNRIDARIHAAHVPGVLPDRLTREQAEVIVQAVNAVGLSAAGFPQTKMPDLDHPIVVHHASCTAEGLEVLGLRGARTSLVRWSDLEFVSVGYVPQETAHHSNTESMVVVHSAPHTFDETSDSPTLSGPECWLIARHPQRIFFLNHNRMNYDYLGPRKTGSATMNFGEFLKDVAHSAEGAFLTPATHVILKHGSADDYMFADSQRLKQATLVQYLLHRVIEADQLPDHQ